MSTRSANSTASSMLWVTVSTARVGMALVVHRLSSSPRRLSAVRTSRAENGSSIRRTSGSTASARAHADALAHPAGQLTRIGGLEAIEADELDQLERLVSAHRGRHAPCLESELHVAEDVEPGQERERLEDHRDAGTGSINDVPAIAHLAAARWDQPCENPEQGGLSRARLPQQGHDLAFAKRQVHILEDGELGVAGGQRHALRHAPGFDQGEARHAVGPHSSLNRLLASRSSGRQTRRFTAIT